MKTAHSNDRYHLIGAPQAPFGDVAARRCCKRSAPESGLAGRRSDSGKKGGSFDTHTVLRYPPCRDAKYACFVGCWGGCLRSSVPCEPRVMYDKGVIGAAPLVCRRMSGE